MKRGEDLSSEGLERIINIKASLNRGLSPVLKESTFGWFSEAESKNMKLGKRVELIFVLTQHIRDELLLKSVVNFFSCGNCYCYKNHLEYVSQSFKDNFEKILPFFRKYNIIGVKSQDFNDWSIVREMINSKAHLTKQGFDEIKKIKESMNKSRFI